MSNRRDKPFDDMDRSELENYARNWSLAGAESMSDDELRKRLRDAQGTTGVAPESSLPLEHKGDPGRGPRR